MKSGDDHCIPIYPIRSVDTNHNHVVLKLITTVACMVKLLNL